MAMLLACLRWVFRKDCDARSRPRTRFPEREFVLWCVYGASAREEHVRGHLLIRLASQLREHFTRDALEWPVAAAYFSALSEGLSVFLPHSQKYVTAWIAVDLGIRDKLAITDLFALALYDDVEGRSFESAWRKKIGDHRLTMHIKIALGDWYRHLEADDPDG